MAFSFYFSHSFVRICINYSPKPKQLRFFPKKKSHTTKKTTTCYSHVSWNNALPPSHTHLHSTTFFPTNFSTKNPSGCRLKPKESNLEICLTVRCSISFRWRSLPQRRFPLRSPTCGRITWFVYRRGRSLERGYTGSPPTLSGGYVTLYL